MKINMERRAQLRRLKQSIYDAALDGIRAKIFCDGSTKFGRDYDDLSDADIIKVKRKIRAKLEELKSKCR